MTDYLITNNAAILGGTEDASVPGSFNPLYADHALRFDEASAASLSLPAINDLWIRADCYYDDFDLTSSGDGYFWAVAVPNIDLTMMDYANGIISLDYANSSFTSPLQTGPPVSGIPDAQLFTLDVHIETGVAVNGDTDDFRVSFYVDLSLIGQILSKNNNLNGAPPVRFDFGGVEFLDGNQRFFLSNVLVSDQDTRGRRFRILRPTGAGALATVEGGYSELGDGDSATFAYARAVGDAVTSTLTPGASPPGTIGKIILASYARNAVEVPNPATVVNRLRIAGTDYDATGLSPASGSIEALSSEWALNPATGLPWTWADLATLEIGFMGDT
ncbi:hypothetical protein KL867_18665 [Ruegeria litorea]|uniref:Uncharacterized protein n=1 Tax=Falsiruegeria litorea TaxID=1280831 RepID=A0ABS5WVC3_9RHOB|nr:hypothetical protein [Falsiruegeria litorea]MBT3143094.1 hypothetical protein [Falsiruegeria litorea]